MFFDNPYVDTAKTSDANFEQYNLLKGFSKYLEETDVGQAGSMINAIFKGLIKSLDAQAYIRYIFKTIVSRVNLIELEKFINEKLSPDNVPSYLNPKIRSDGKLQED